MENIYPWCKKLRPAKSEQFLFLVIITTLFHKSSCLTGWPGARRRAPIPKTCIHRIIPIQFIQLALKLVSMCLEAIFSRMPVGRDGYTGPLGRAPASCSPIVRSVLAYTGSCRKAYPCWRRVTIITTKKMTGALVHLRPNTPIM